MKWQRTVATNVIGYKIHSLRIRGRWSLGESFRQGFLEEAVKVRLGGWLGFKRQQRRRACERKQQPDGAYV